jgi:hypothetical protein
MVGRMIRLAGSGAALLALLATAGAGLSEGGSVIITGGSGTSAYTATLVQVPQNGATPAAVNVTLTINSQACGGACGWMSFGFGGGMAGSRTHTCFQSDVATQLCATELAKPPTCRTQSPVVANSVTFNSGGNFVCSFVSSEIGGFGWDRIGGSTPPLVIAYGKGASYSLMSQHAVGAGWSLGSRVFTNSTSSPSSPTNSAAQTGAGVISALLMVLATLL